MSSLLLDLMPEYSIFQPSTQAVDVKVLKEFLANIQLLTAIFSTGNEGTVELLEYFIV